QKLDVAELLEGSVQREQDRVRVTARLIRAQDGFGLWSESFDRQLKDIFAVEDDIAQAVASALQVKLLASRSPAAVANSATISPEGYESFLHARYFEHMGDEASLKKALLYANKAIESDPNFAPAYALRADVQLIAAGMTWIDLSQASEAVRRDTEKTLALDPNLADGYRLLSQISSWIESNCPAAETPMKRALDLAPGDPDNLGRSGMLAMCLGQPERAIQLWKQELVLDPLRPDEYLWLAQALRDLGRYEEADSALSKALDLNPNQVEMIHEIKGEVYLAQGRPQDALPEMQMEPPGLFRDLGLALAYFALNQRQESNAALSRILAEYSQNAAYQIAQVYGYRSEVDQAFDWLNRAYAQHDPGLMWIKTDPKLKSLRTDARYSDMLRKLNLPE
ncbi:MAG TPA: tetratricopeptide repeat protein, partial [Candidatus Binatia bacterium]|nr:tetratricopeptide repeat protein [Candidatus Binatia bacterium]